MTTANRKTAREYLATILQTGLTGVGNPVQAVYSYKRGEFTGSPVVLVYSGNTLRQKTGKGESGYTSNWRLIVELWLADAESSTGWTEQNVEDALDNIDKAIADIISSNRYAAGVWDFIDYEPLPSMIFGVTTKGGQNYIVERFYLLPVKFD